MPWYLKITIKILLILVLVICVQYLHLVSRKKDSNIFEFNVCDCDCLKNNHSPSQFCPKSFEITDTENGWFKTTFEQISPFANQTSNSSNNSNNEDLMFPSVVIMTPISNVRYKMKHYFQMLCSLTYPHDKISVVLGEDSSHDQTLYEAEDIAVMLRPYFNRIEVFHLNGNQPYSEGNFRHSREYQLIRRKHLAMSRNQILSRGLKKETWVLWLDADVRHIPADLIQHLMSAKKDIVTANCLYRMSDGRMDTFDRNTWQETVESLFDLRDKPSNYLMLEGYGVSKRKFLNDLKMSENDQSAKSSNRNNEVVKLDGVGGCVLLVNADLHRRGLNFPPFPFNHHIETEGFAKMAHQVYGVQPYGLPWIHVIHW